MVGMGTTRLILDP